MYSMYEVSLNQNLDRNINKTKIAGAGANQEVITLNEVSNYTTLSLKINLTFKSYYTKSKMITNI